MTSTRREFAEYINKWTRNMEQAITVRKFAEGIGSAAFIGIVIGIIIAHRPKKKTIEGLDNQTSNSTVTIEVQDLQKLIIERIE